MMGGTIEKNNRRFKQLAEAQMYLAQMDQEVCELPSAKRWHQDMIHLAFHVLGSDVRSCACASVDSVAENCVRFLKAQADLRSEHGRMPVM